LLAPAEKPQRLMVGTASPGRCLLLMGEFTRWQKKLVCSDGEGVQGHQRSIFLQRWGAEGIRSSAVALTQLSGGLGL